MYQRLTPERIGFVLALFCHRQFPLFAFTGHYPRAPRRHQRGKPCADPPAGHCMQPTAELVRTERDPISTSGLSISMSPKKGIMLRQSADVHARNDVACVCLTSGLLCLTVTMIEEGVHMERINVRVDERLKQELESEAREKGVRPSDIVRQALEEHMRSRTPSPNCRELAEP